MLDLEVRVPLTGGTYEVCCDENIAIGDLTGLVRDLVRRKEGLGPAGGNRALSLYHIEGECRMEAGRPLRTYSVRNGDRLVLL